MVHERPTLRATLESIWSLTGPDDFDVVAPSETALPYSSVARRGIKPLADVYLPASPPATRPSVVLVHGGGFLVGNRRMKPMRMLASHLVNRGFAVCSLDYRMIFKGGRLAESIEDVVSGLSWWSDNSKRFDFDNNRIALMGLSAGGALTVIASGHQLAPPVARTISVFGLYDFTALSGGLTGRLPKLLTRSRDPSVWRAASPITAPTSAAPLLLLHGTADSVVNIGQADALAARRSEAGLATHLHRYDGAPHAFLNRAGPVADRALADIDAFLNPLLAARAGGVAA